MSVMTEVNFKKIKRVLWIILFANLCVAVLKIVIGNMIQSTSMTADGFHSLADGSSNVIGLIGISLASKPVDKDHPYGHKKFEMLAGLFIAGMLFFVGGKIIIEALSRLMNPVAPHITMESLITLISTLVVNIFICSYEYKQGKVLGSYILVSDSLHTKSDIYVSVGVLFTLVSVRLGLPSIIDPLSSLIVAGFIIHASWDIFKSTSSILVDTAKVDEEKVQEIIMEFAQIKSVHKIRSRGTEDDVYIDMHIMTEPDMSVKQSHDLTHDIEKKMRQKINKNIHVVVHIEPYYIEPTANL